LLLTLSASQPNLAANYQQSLLNNRYDSHLLSAYCQSYHLGNSYVVPIIEIAALENGKNLEICEVVITDTDGAVVTLDTANGVFTSHASNSYGTEDVVDGDISTCATIPAHSDNSPQFLGLRMPDDTEIGSIKVTSGSGSGSESSTPSAYEISYNGESIGGTARSYNSNSFLSNPTFLQPDSAQFTSEYTLSSESHRK
jgi:hypothetical protein